MLTGELLARLQSLWQEGDQLDHATTLRHEKRLNITPDTGQLLYQLVRHQRGGDILEIGTSNGYSTLWLADAVRDTGGSLCTLEIDKARKKAARQNLREAKLEDFVRMEVCDAGEFLRDYSKYFDVVLLDADRSQYTAYWPHLQRILTKPGSLLVVDNVLSHADEVQAFIALVEADKNFSSMVLDIGAGLLLASSV
mgnify:CR=1 FL=1